MKLLARIAGRIALVCLGLLVAMVAGEVGLRLLGLARPAFYTYDQYRGWALRPGATGWDVKEGEGYVRINREGFRGPEAAFAKPPSTIRIAVLGDSFTEAQQLPEDRTFCAVIGRKLGECAASGGRKVEVLNLGVNGYGTAQELMTLRHQAWRFSPDIVVLAVFTGNDIMNNSVTLETERCRPFYVYRNGEMVLAGPLWDSPVTRMQCMMRFESRLRFDTHGSEMLRMFDAGLRALKDRLPGKHRSHHETTGSELGINDVIYKPPTNTVWRDAWQVTEGEIAQINREVKAHGAALLVVSLTTGIQVWPDPAVRQQYMQRLGVSDLWYPDERLAALGRREGFAVLVLSQPMQAYAQQHHVFLHGFKNTKLGEGHWNELGHQVGGELIATRLCQMLGSGKSQSRPNDKPKNNEQASPPVNGVSTFVVGRNTVDCHPETKWGGVGRARVRDRHAAILSAGVGVDSAGTARPCSTRRFGGKSSIRQMADWTVQMVIHVARRTGLSQRVIISNEHIN